MVRIRSICAAIGKPSTLLSPCTIENARHAPLGVWDGKHLRFIGWMASSIWPRRLQSVDLIKGDLPVFCMNVSCEELGCYQPNRGVRIRHPTTAVLGPPPAFHFGKIGSSMIFMRPATHRDTCANQFGFEWKVLAHGKAFRRWLWNL